MNLQFVAHFNYNSFSSCQIAPNKHKIVFFFLLLPCCTHFIILTGCNSPSLGCKKKNEKNKQKRVPTVVALRVNILSVSWYISKS